MLVILQGRIFDDYYVNICEDSVSTGGSWQWDRHHVPAAYGPAALRFFYHKLMDIENPVYLDVGANTGSFTQLTAIVPGSFCHAFEPNPVIWEKLRCNAHLMGLGKNVDCYNVALWNEPAKLVFNIPYGDNTGMARLVHRIVDIFEDQYQIELMAFPLDDLMRDTHIDLIKIDVEGAELMVLQGAERIIRESKPGIMLEWVPGHCKPFGYHPEEIDTFLGGMGYEKEYVSVEDVYYRAKV